MAIHRNLKAVYKLTARHIPNSVRSYSWYVSSLFVTLHSG